MFIKFNEETRKILKRSRKETKKLKHSFIGSEHVILSILYNTNEISQRLLEYHVNYDLYLNELIKSIGYGKNNDNYFIYTPLLKRVLQNAIYNVKDNGCNEVMITDLFLAILDEGEGVGNRILNNLGVNIEDLYQKISKDKILKSHQQKLSILSCAVDMNKKCLENQDLLIGREEELQELINILLRKNKNNPLLIGEAGVGKTAIVEELARRINQGNVPDALKKKKILSLSMAKVVAGTKYRGEFEEKITKFIKELENNDHLILFIDEIHTIVGAGGAEGAIDAANILKPALARGQIKVIGATTIKEYKETILKDKALARRFQKILVKENTIPETITILKQLKPLYEKYHYVTISDDLIEKLVLLTDKYINNENNPDKSLDILDSVLTKVSIKENKTTLKIKHLKEELENETREKNFKIIQGDYQLAYQYHINEMKIESMINKLEINMKDKQYLDVTINDIAETIERKTNIPIYEINNNYHKLKLLSKYLNNKIIGQEKVIELIDKVTKKYFFGYKNDLPNSFLFLGKSGVGKTLLVKEYSKFLNIPLIRLDMSEYKEPHSVSKIIGSPPGYIGYDNFDVVVEKIKNNPYCIMLLDEVEKGCQEVINLFLEGLDEGFITDSHGIKVNLSNTTIIMTSNIGYDNEKIGFENDDNHESDIRNILSIAIVNRISNICYFNNINHIILKKILLKKISEMRKKYRDHHITIHVSNDIINQIIEHSDYQVYGCRKALKMLEDRIDDLVIEGMFNNLKNVYIK